MRFQSALLVWCVAAGSTAFAQDAPAAPPVWQWNVDANVFAGFNYQHRRFWDFSTWESQNWMMAGGERRAGSDRLRVSAMLSFEPFTMHDLGSPQVFQTGETFQRAPLVDYQHPHDLVMGLGGDYQRTTGGTTILLGGDIVGSPTLGPPVFMH